MPRLRTHADDSRVLHRQITARSQYTEVPGNVKIEVLLVNVKTADIPSVLPQSHITFILRSTGCCCYSASKTAAGSSRWFNKYFHFYSNYVPVAIMNHSRDIRCSLAHHFVIWP